MKNRTHRNAVATPAPAAALMQAAMAGILGAATLMGAGCDDAATPAAGQAAKDASDDGAATMMDGNSVTHGGSSMGGGATGAPCTVPQVLGTSKAPAGLTYGKFVEDCKNKNGYPQMHASCAGTVAGRGTSLNRWDGVITAHSCRGMNTCGGVSCVELAAENTLTGAALYKDAGCNGCHGDEAFAVFVPAGTNQEQATAAFKARTDLGLEIVVAFGQQGREGEVASRSNMPAFHEKLSRPATERVVQYVRTLPVKVSEYPKLEADKPIVETE